MPCPCQILAPMHKFWSSVPGWMVTLKTVTPTLSHVSSATRPVIVTTPTAQLVPTGATSLAAMDPTQELPIQNNYSSAVCIDDVLEPTNFDFSCSTPINIARLEQELSFLPILTRFLFRIS